jgi:hypothetical protein
MSSEIGLGLFSIPAQRHTTLPLSTQSFSVPVLFSDAHQHLGIS